MVISSTVDRDKSKIVYIVVGVIVPVLMILALLMGLILYFKKIDRNNRAMPRVPPRIRPIPDSFLSKPALDLENMFATVRYSSLVLRYLLDCPVCLESFLPETWVRQLHCGHVYHKECLEGLAERQPVCCICKRDFEGKSAFSVLTTQGDASYVGHSEFM